MIWPWSRIAELEAALQLQAREVESARHDQYLESAEKDAERARRVGAEALAAERKEECQRLREDLAAARQAEREARDLMAKSLVESNVRLTSPAQDKPPDMDKIREMMPQQDMSQLTRGAIGLHRAREQRIQDILLRKYYPAFMARMDSKQPVVAEENPPGEGERPSLNAVG